MTRNKLLVIIAIVGGVAAFQLVHVNRAKDSETDTTVPISVTVAEVQQRELPLTIAAVGRIEAKASVTVKSRLDGQVSEVVYAEGKRVHKGQVLLRFVPALLEAQQRQAESVLARDEAQLARVKGDYERNLALFGKGFISKSGLSQSAADLHSAEASLNADRAGLDSARVQLDYTRITAPIDGVAGALLLPVGGAAKANDTALLVINQITPIYLSFSLPEAQLAPVKQALSKGEVEVSATIDGIAQPLVGKLAFLDNAVDTTSGAITAKAIFANTDGLLTPGQFARVALQLGKLPDALVVPSQAVESGINGSYAFVVNADSTVEIRQLRLSGEAGAFSVVSNGLAAGERVVTSGQARLREKAKVSIAAAVGR